MSIAVPGYNNSKIASKFVISKLINSVGIDLDGDADPACANMVLFCIGNLPSDLIRECCIKTLGFEDLGPSAKYYPNHGYYRTPGDILVLNKRMLEDPIHGVSDDGRDISTFEFILAHELGHGWDAAQGNKDVGQDYSMCQEWLSLSDWSETPKPGHKRLRIVEDGYPEKVGEWYYSPSANFSRYYGKMNPWDDWADSFAYYVTGMKTKIPTDKLTYFNEKLGKYYGDKVSVPHIKKASAQENALIESIKAKSPDFIESLVRYTNYKELDRRGISHGVVIPTLREYLHNYMDKDENTLKKYLGKVPAKDSGIENILNDYLKKNNTMPEMRGEVQSPGMFKKLFTRGLNMKDRVKVASVLTGIADKLDDKGHFFKAAEIRSAVKRLASDAEENFPVGTAGEGVKSIEEFL
jgi:hypothetical protein